MSVFQVRTGDLVTNIGHGVPFLIAECCNNFQGSIEIARAMIASAAEAGAHAVKFQHRGRLSFAQLLELRATAQQCGLHFLCTGYTMPGQAELVNKELVQTLKIGSAEATDVDYLRLVASLGLPTIVSTGCMTAADVEQIVDIFHEAGTPLALMHTVSIYPTPIEQANLCAFQQIDLMKRDYSIRRGDAIGYSDHTATIEAVTAAIVLGAQIVEMHFTLSRNLPGPDQCVSFEPPEFAAIARFARAWPTMRDNPRKEPLPEERTKIDLFRKEEWRR